MGSLHEAEPALVGTSLFYREAEAIPSQPDTKAAQLRRNHAIPQRGSGASEQAGATP